MIVFQGLEDAIVPPEQAEMIVAALAKKGLPHAYLAFAGEQHGFRKAANIVRSLEAELYFYGRVFGFAPAEQIEPVEIKTSEGRAGGGSPAAAQAVRPLLRCVRGGCRRGRPARRVPFQRAL